MSVIMKASNSQESHRWVVLSLTLLVMTIVQPLGAQDDDDEPLVLASENKMQTDSLSTDTFGFSSFSSFEETAIDGLVQLPVMGRAKVGENNSALPRDRFYFIYKHFHNSLNTTLGDGFGTELANRDFSLDRYNVGLEKTFDDGVWSVEARMPVFSCVNFFDANFSDHLGGVGNLSVIGKRVLSVSDTTVWAAGLGLSVPTGADAEIRVADELFTVQNKAVHLFPFLGFLAVPTQNTFLQGFIQLDGPVNGNGLTVRDTSLGMGSRHFGSMRDQTLLYVDLSAGQTLYQNRSAPGITSLASSITLSYTTSLEDANTLAGSTDFSEFSATEFALGNAANRFDVVNIGAGLYTTWRNRVTIYAGVVTPLDNGANRFFDMEAQMSANIGY